MKDMIPVANLNALFNTVHCLDNICLLFFPFYSFPFLQFSDGVGYGWIDSLRDHADKNVSDLMFQNASFRFPENTPVSKEAYYYRSIFEEHYPQVNPRSVIYVYFTEDVDISGLLEFPSRHVAA